MPPSLSNTTAANSEAQSPEGGSNTDWEEVDEFLLRSAELLSRFGTPSHRLERVVVRVAESLGRKAACLYTPTSLMLSFGEGPDERTRMRRVDAGETNLGKLIDFDEVLEDVEHGRIDLVRATLRMNAVADAPPRYGAIAVGLACSLGSAGATLFLGGGMSEILVAAILGAFIFLVGWLVERLPTSQSLAVPLAGFLAAILSIMLSRWVVAVDDRFATLGSLVILLPGLSFTVAMAELASKHLVAGTSRMASAAVTFITMTVGVALAWRLAGALRGESVDRIEPPSWLLLAAVVVVPLAFAVLLQARRSEWPVILTVAVLGFAAAKIGAWLLGSEFAPFLGALAVGCASNSYARWIDRPASVPLIPGILLLVPGSVGYRSLTAFLENQAVQGIELAFTTTLVAASLVGGLLVANVVVPPKRLL